MRRITAFGSRFDLRQATAEGRRKMLKSQSFIAIQHTGQHSRQSSGQPFASPGPASCAKSHRPWLPIVIGVMLAGALVYPLPARAASGPCIDAISKEAKKLCGRAEAGDPRGQLAYAVLLLNGHGVAPNERTAAKYLQAAAEQGEPSAQVMYGDMLEHGRGTPRNPSLAARYYQMAADYPDPEKHDDIRRPHPSPRLVTSVAQVNLGYLFEIGNGVPRSLDMAVHYYKIAAAHGDNFAIRSLDRLGLNQAPK